MDLGIAEDARQLHHERGAGAVVVGRFAPSYAVHVPGHDVHLFRMRVADLGAVDLLPFTGDGGRGIEFAKLEVRLLERIVVHGVGSAHDVG